MQRYKKSGRFHYYFVILSQNQNAMLTQLTAISPVDGRYRRVAEPLAEYFSEYALIKNRVRVEVEYFIALCELPLPELEGVDHAIFDTLRDIYRNFTTIFQY